MTTVFSNGCFDVVHIGHIHLLQQARALGDRLIVGLNTDNSVRSLGKGPNRPINNQWDRMAVLRELRCVDAVLLFDEPTPENLIQTLRPDILVKGSDWQDRRTEVAGYEWMQIHNRRVVFIPLVPGYSTTRILEKANT
jgi:rfaE bifunctional protein nucleotidyltransferase chain/domain